MGDLSGQVAFVTDGWHGVGHAITRTLLADGVTVGVGYSKPDPVVDEFVEAHLEDRVSLHQGSIALAEDCYDAIGEVVRRHGRLDILVAMLNYRASGILSMRRPLTRVPEPEWRRTLDAHLSGAFHLAQAALGHMVPARYGRIVFVLGTAGVGDGQGHHATVRGGLRELTRELARETAGSGITVNRVQTGLVRDELLDGLPKAVVNQAVEKIPARRLGQAEEVGRVVSFLAHPDSGYLTGQHLAVDGGLTLDVD